MNSTEINSSIIPNLRLNTNASVKAQPKGTYRFALNAVKESDSGQQPFISSELGNRESAVLPSDSTVLGSRLLNDDRFVVFLVTPQTSIIAYYNPTNHSYEEIVNDPCLNFNKNHPIKCLFRITKGCNVTIYFTDNYNPYRTMDLSNLSQYYTNGNFDCSKILLNNPYTIPDIDLISVNDSGGKFKVGTILLAPKYLDNNLNETNFITVTNPIPIVDEPLSSSYANIDGAVNIIDSQDEGGAVPVTNKSITIQLTNLDARFKYFKIAVLYANSATGLIDTVLETEAIPITGPIQQYTLTGANMSSSSIDTIQNDFLTIDKVEAHTQIDNRLILGNVSAKEYKWAEVQQAAQFIKLNWVNTPLAKNSISTSAKSPFYYFNTRSYCRDEVYAFGIQGILKNGDRTPVFHIPGRTVESADLQPLTIVATEAEQNSSNVWWVNIAHLGYAALNVGETIPRWKVYNTARITANLERKMSYWESNVDYPSSLDCNGTRIYPIGKVRHHKFPEIDLAPIEDENNIYTLGFTADLSLFLNEVQLADIDLYNDVQKWEIVRADRDEVNRTIVDKGYFVNAYYDYSSVSTSTGVIHLTEDQYWFPIYINSEPFLPESEYIGFWLSPKSMIARKNIQSTYLKYIGYQEVNYTSVAGGINLVGFINTNTSILNLNSTISNKLISNQVYLDNNPMPESSSPFSYIGATTSLGNYKVINNTWIHPAHAIELNDISPLFAEPITRPNELKLVVRYSSLKIDNNIHSSLGNIIYFNIGDTTNNVYYGGDTFISKFGFTHYAPRGQVSTHIYGYYESDINAELRHANNNYNDSSVKYGNLPLTYFKGDETNPTDVDQYFRVGTEPNVYIEGRQEGYFYNLDYSKSNVEKPYFPIPNTFNYCSDCLNIFPYRYYYSDKSYQDNIIDNYRIFRDNNFQEIPGTYDPINNLFIDRNNLYVQTASELYFQPTREQTLNTNESNIFVSTGEFFGIAPRKLGNSEQPYAGAEYYLGTQTTEFGTFFVDSNGRKVYNLSEQLTDISSPDIKTFCDANLPIQLNQQIQEITGVKVKVGYPEVGYLSTYDPYYRRYIITKKDYKLIPYYLLDKVVDSSYEGPYADGKLYFDLDNNKFFFWLGYRKQFIDYEDTRYFENKSFTLSFDCRSRTWVSFHSYLPYNYLADEASFYSVKTNTSNIWKHDSNFFQTYYTEKKDMIIDLPFNEQMLTTKSTDNLSIVCDTEYFDYAYNEYTDTDKFFDRVLLYNSTQCSGLQSIDIKDINSWTNPPLTYDSTRAIKVEKTWNLSEFRDVIPENNTLPIFSSHWNHIQNDYYIDKVINPDIQLNTNSLFTKSRFRDKWLGVRLYFNPVDNIRMNLNVISTQDRISYR